MTKTIAQLLIKLVENEEIAFLKEQFMKIDSDKSGMLDVNEIKVAVLNSKIKMSEKDVHRLIQNIDNNSNVKIDYTEFLVATIDLKNIVTDELLASLFSCFDVNSA